MSHHQPPVSDLVALNHLVVAVLEKALADAVRSNNRRRAAKVKKKLEEVLSRKPKERS